MKPVDFRNATFDTLATYIVGQRERVFKAWGMHGPCTTRELAQRSGIDVLNIRPRTTELETLGFVRLDEKQTSKTEGRYRVSTPDELADFLADRRREALTPQREFALGV